MRTKRLQDFLKSHRKRRSVEKWGVNLGQPTEYKLIKNLDDDHIENIITWIQGGKGGWSLIPSRSEEVVSMFEDEQLYRKILKRTDKK